MSTSRSTDRAMLSASHDATRFNPQVSPSLSMKPSKSFSSPPMDSYHSHKSSIPQDMMYNSADIHKTTSLHNHLTSLSSSQNDKLSESHKDRLQQTHIVADRSHDQLAGDKRIMRIVPPAPLPKKARYDTMRSNHVSQSQKMHQLHIDTNIGPQKMKMEGASGYHPETEAISPTLPTESHNSKSEIVNSISRVDKELNSIENKLAQLEKKQESLEVEANKPKEEIPDEELTNESRSLSLSQIVYRENKKLALRSQNSLAKLGSPVELPLYNQPSDTEIFYENLKQYRSFKSLLQSHLKRKAADMVKRQEYTAACYEKLVTGWLKKVDTKTLKKSVKDQKTREYFEKVFPEIKKTREDKERITNRVGSRGVSSGYARTEAEFEQIVDGITEQEEEDKKMKAYAIIPPVLDPKRRKLRFLNKNGLISGSLSFYNDYKQSVTWTPEEETVFKDKYMERPKQFGLIALSLEKKNLNDCVLYYYTNKKVVKFKQLLKKQVKRPHRKQTMKPSMRNSNEGQVEAYTEAHTEQNKKSDEEIVSVTRKTQNDPRISSCVVCNVKLESYSLSHAVTKSSCHQYGLKESDHQSDWRVCANCAKIRRRRSTWCPIPSCTSRSRARNLRLKWNEISLTTKASIFKELDMTEEVSKCCSTCYQKIVDVLGHNGIHALTRSPDDIITKWNDVEITSLKKAITAHGKDWVQISRQVDSKSPTQCKMFFYRNKRRHELQTIYNGHKAKKAEQLGCEPAPSDDSVYDDEDDDDDYDDNNEDQSSENENSNSAASGSAVDFSKVVKDEKAELIGEKTKVKHGVELGNTSNQTSLGAKTEKIDHDSSATASADEDININTTHVDTKSMNEYNDPRAKATSFIKQEPGLMHDPDGLMPHSLPFSNFTPKSMLQAPSHRLVSTTSVKELIDSTIEDVLTNPSQGDSHDSASKTNAADNLNRLSTSSNRSTPVSMKDGHLDPSRSISSKNMSKTQSRPSVIKDEPSSRKQIPLPPYKGSPYDFSIARPPSHGHMTNDISQHREPPPAHSHHSNPSSLDQRYNTDRKSGDGPFSIYDVQPSPNHRASPVVNKLGLPPPLIPGQSHMAIKRENGSYAGGSILQGTSASLLAQQSQQPNNNNNNRFDLGSISHGTPRNQESNRSIGTRDDKSTSSQSPRPPQPSVSPAMHNQQQIDKFLEQQQQQQQQQVYQMMFQEYMRNYPMSSYDYTKSVLQNDFLTAKQMGESAALRSSALYGGKDDNLAKEQLLAFQAALASQGLPHNMFGSHQAMLNNFILQNSHPLASKLTSDQHRALSNSSVSPHNPRSVTPKNDPTKLWNTDSNRGQLQPKLHQGISKKVENIQRSELNRKSVSPHRKTHYEKEVEEVRRRTRADIERTLSEDSNSQHALYLNNKNSDMYNLSRSSPAIGGRLDGRPDASKYPGGSLISGHSKRAEDAAKELNKQREERRLIMEEDSRLSAQMKSESNSRCDDQVIDLSQSESNKQKHFEDEVNRKRSIESSSFASKKLAEVYKGLEKDQLHKDASSLFSSSFEKDHELAEKSRRRMTPGLDETPSSISAASIIDAIIMRQINSADSDNAASKSAEPPAALQHTSVIRHPSSVIVPPKKQRGVHLSRSDTDIASHILDHRKRSSPCPNEQLRPASINEKLHDIIVKDYNLSNRRESSNGNKSSNYLTNRPYRVDDVEPISPPNVNGSHKSAMKPSQLGQPGKLTIGKKHSGIRSLLGADTGHESSNHKLEHHEAYGMSSPIDYVKSKIEEAIRHDGDYDMSKNSKLPYRNNLPSMPPVSMAPVSMAGHNRHEESANIKESSKKRGLEAMLTSGKRPALSPHRAKSPEEIDVYSSMNNTSSGAGKLSSSMAPSSTQNATFYLPGAGSQSAALLTSYQNSPLINHDFQSKSGVAGMHYTSPGVNPGGYMHPAGVRNSISPRPRSHSNRSNSSERSEPTKYLDDNSKNMSASFIGSRQSPLQAFPTSGANSNRQSPHSHRQSPLLTKSSALQNSRAPIDRVSSPSSANIKNCESPTGKHYSLNDNSRNDKHFNTDSFNPQKESRFFNILTSNKPLLSEQYETLSDDES